MTADNVIAKYAHDLILDMYQCAKLGIFKGYINWFAAIAASICTILQIYRIEKMTE